MRPGFDPNRESIVSVRHRKLLEHALMHCLSSVKVSRLDSLVISNTLSVAKPENGRESLQKEYTCFFLRFAELCFGFAGEI